ncbi:NADH:flavin oxidoreductase/NADH oxidase [Mycobacterium sp. PS03-16]|uniref:NADH:flavin oxidoreductase/NADH oxidase n=1 Tax=Mycobacterium sp. PS03-16 TaxID=2559611 RepID=UPI001073B791|nr:NADH:flavin oxidoreductase/NADH oxidase [Mycobacterium sp. PS03-16]TFV59417.1 NADH:flavin oxidoreductase/NADH oxidase [Mycobacterium sp. PS03-16]
MSALFTPLTLREVRFAHRAWMSPMMQFSAVPAGAHEGAPTDWHLAHLGSRAVAGAALVMAEATAVDPVGRSSVHDLGLWNSAQADAFRRITAFVTAAGSIPGIQLVHAGRKGATGRPWADEGGVDDYRWRTVGPSAVPFGRLPNPAELSVAEIARIVEAFAASARLAADAGFRVLELHGAHGYLIHQFLSPYSNTRTDGYGGALTSRLRFALEVVEAVRGAWPDELPLFFRVSATDWLGGDTDDERPGWTVADTLELATQLKVRGVDLMDVSSGGSAPDARIPVAPGYQVPFAARVRKEVEIATSAVGLITDADQAEGVVAGEQADAVFLARVLLRNPAWIRQAADQLGATLDYPPQYRRAFV